VRIQLQNPSAVGVNPTDLHRDRAPPPTWPGDLIGVDVVCIGGNGARNTSPCGKILFVDARTQYRAVAFAFSLTAAKEVADNLNHFSFAQDSGSVDNMCPRS
jgi:hypothetical protein